MAGVRGLAMKTGSVLASVALTGLVLSPCLAFAADAARPSEKAETVNVTAAADGSVESVEVTTTLKNASGSALLEDSADLDDIAGDDVTYALQDGLLIWQADGEDVTYSGETHAGLPVSMRVSYALDGRAVSPDDLAGKAGSVTIRYDFQNNCPFEAAIGGANVSLYTPFTCITALMLDGDAFSNVSVDNGKIIDDGSDSIVMGYTMPGLKESLGSLGDDSDIPSYFEVHADTTGFDLKASMTIVTAGLLSDLDVDAMGLGDMDETSQGLTEAMDALVSGSDELASGLDQLAEGADSLASGAKDLNDGLYLLTYGEDGRSGLSAAGDSAGQLASGLGSVDENLTAAASGLSAASSNLAAIAESYPDDAGLPALLSATEAISDDSAKQAIQQILSSTAQVKALSSGISQASSGISALSTEYSEIVRQAKSLPEGLAQAAAAAKRLYAGSESLSEGARQLAAGVSGAASGSDALTEGLQAFDDEGISKIVDVIDNDLGGLKKRLKALSQNAKEYDTFSGKQEGVPSSVKFIYQTAAIEAE